MLRDLLGLDQLSKRGHMSYFGRIACWCLSLIVYVVLLFFLFSAIGNDIDIAFHFLHNLCINIELVVLTIYYISWV